MKEEIISMKAFPVLCLLLIFQHQNILNKLQMGSWLPVTTVSSGYSHHIKTHFSMNAKNESRLSIHRHTEDL